jgi:hypothetical protein
MVDGLFGLTYNSVFRIFTPFKSEFLSKTQYYLFPFHGDILTLQL